MTTIEASTLTDFHATTIDGRDLSFDEYKGQVVLVVNVASECGFTPQYEGLEQLYRKYGDEGLVVLGFPCDQFGNQEPGSEEAIQEFCSTRFAVSFPMFAKVEVNGKTAHPLFRWLRSQTSGLTSDKVRWNFTKFLVGRDGRVIKRYGSSLEPMSIAADVEEALAA